MNIKEAEKATGVSSRNIRFYEQKGLLKPSRNKENDYREYSPEDIHSLRLIRALRMVDMPLEQIKKIMDGEVSMQEAVSRQKNELKQKINQIETAVHFCDELERADDQNIVEVLMRMDEPENSSMLSKKWPSDYRQTVKTGVIAFLAAVLPGLVIILAILFCPLDDRITPETTQLLMSRGMQVWVETEDQSHVITTSTEFSEIFRFGEWKRQYFPTGNREIVLEVHMFADRTEPHAIEFYSDGTARIYEEWLFLKEGYFFVPGEIANAVLAYAESVSAAEKNQP